MVVGRVIGWLLLLLAAACLGVELADYFRTGAYRVRALGELWFELHRSSLNLAQAVVQRYVHPAAWDPAAVAILQLPGWTVFGLPGVLLAWACAGRRRRGGAADRTGA